MSWRRRMLDRPVCFLVLSISVGLALVPRLTEGAPLPSPERPSRPEVNRVVTLLERKAVGVRLGQLGMTPSEVEAKLDRLDAEELHQLASRAEQLSAGGDAVGAIAAVAIFALLIILILELMGRRVITRP